MHSLPVNPTDSQMRAEYPNKAMWTYTFRKMIRLMRRVWNEAIRGHLYDLELAKTLGISIGMLVTISVLENWLQAWLFNDVGLSYLYFLPIWYSARQGGRLAGGLVSFVTATSWSVMSHSDRPFMAWLTNMTMLVLVMMFFESFERRIRQVNRQASTDGLTGLLNRGAFVTRAKLALDNAERLRSTCALVLLDCNKFKQINDEQGHAAGDQALKTLSRALRDSSQGDDVIGRLGGDEFVVLLTDTDSIGANLFLNRLNGTLRRNSAVLPFEISVSSGVAYYGLDARSLDMLMQIADEKMYRNKQLSRVAAIETVSELSAKSQNVS